MSETNFNASTDDAERLDLRTLQKVRLMLSERAAGIALQLGLGREPHPIDPVVQDEKTRQHISERESSLHAARDNEALTGWLEFTREIDRLIEENKPNL